MATCFRDSIKILIDRNCQLFFFPINWKKFFISLREIIIMFNSALLFALIHTLMEQPSFPFGTKTWLPNVLRISVVASPALESFYSLSCYVFYVLIWCVVPEPRNKILCCQSMQQVQGILKTHIHVGRGVVGREGGGLYHEETLYFKLNFQVLTV